MIIYLFINNIIIAIKFIFNLLFIIVIPILLICLLFIIMISKSLISLLFIIVIPKSLMKDYYNTTICYLFDLLIIF